MVRRPLQLLFLIALLLGCEKAPSGQFEITGTIENTDPEFPMVVLNRFDPISQTRTPVDTAKLDEHGHFTMELALAEPDLFQLRMPGKQTATIVLDPSEDKLQIEAEGKRNGSFSVSGSEATRLLLGYDAFRKESNERLIRPAYAKMTAASKKEDQQAEIDAVEEYVDASKVHRQELLEYTAAHIGTSPALFGTVLRWTGD
ncbi:MAG: DUF4369 domain-containing protein, partial [Saprospiraceae bacterium]|nr:DUF4369 domain-containing protein [Saprospiraceae bacterium]